MLVDTLSKHVREFVLAEVIAPAMWQRLNEVIEYWLKRHQQLWHAYTDVLPCLTCAASGGTATEAIPVASFWLLYFYASKIFDSVQDHDEKDRPWMNGGESEAISLGLSLITAGNISLSYLENPATVREITRSFNRTWMMAAKSQTESQSNLSIDCYFENIIASTGEIFATAAWAGARTTTNDPKILSTFRQYGLYAGTRLAILSDCHGLKTNDPTKPSDIQVGIYKLPVIYAMSMAENPYRTELSQLLTGKPITYEQTVRVLSILDELQAVQWSLSFANLYAQKAIEALSQFTPASVEPLIAYVS